MVCVNELTDLKCNKRAILEPLAIIIAPYAPHIAEELWSLLGNNQTIFGAKWPGLNKEYLIESTFTCPVSFNGKTRFTLDIPLNLSQADVEKIILENEYTLKYLEGKQPRKVIIVPNKIVNIVV
jgi:leucyl-tRNA synthetase